MSTKLTLLFVTGLWLCARAFNSAPQDSETLLAIPFLSDPHMDCRAANQSGEFVYGLVTAAQSLAYSNPTQSVMQLYNSTSCWQCDSCPYRILHPVVRNHLHTLDFSACHDSHNSQCVSWLMLCLRTTYSVDYRILDSPTFTAVFVAISPSAQQVLAVYPVPAVANTSYVYHVLHGTQHAGGDVQGFTVQNPYSVDVVVSFRLTSHATGWINSHELVRVDETVTLGCKDVMWVEPNGTESLSGTVLSSDMPLNVFTSQAPCRNETVLDFHYNSQLVHQMPERNRWGRQFLIDATHSEVVPQGIRECLMHTITIVSHTPANAITLMRNTSSSTTKLGEPPTALPGGHYEHRLDLTGMEMEEAQILHINSTHPILVLVDTYTDTSLASACPDATVKFSTLVQPREWYANKQIVVLVHPRPMVAYSYHITVHILSNRTNPADIIESESGKFCNGTSLDRYNVQRYSVRGEENQALLVYRRHMLNSSATQTRLLLRHSDPLVCMGVTVHAYSKDLHYSYSNGYTLGSHYKDDERFCVVNVETGESGAPHHTVAISIGSTLAIALPALIVGTVLALVWLKRRRKKRSSVPYDQLPPAVAAADSEYPYDVFILCSDRDEEFVKECIESPLNDRGYTTMRKSTAPDGLFMTGNFIVADIDHVVRICSRVIAVCSESYSCRGCGGSDGHSSMEIKCCKEMMAAQCSRIIPVVLDGAEAAEFAKVTQHRIRTADVLSSMKARGAFIKKLERDMNIRKSQTK